jgi:phenylpropionate dioxygenase-like ring-hydroxylating dioxygenase large terminal subunit
VLARERELLFAHAWQYAGHAGQLAEPGSYFTLRAGDVPLVVVRDREGELRAFVNVCRHRGAEVVSGEGRCTTLQCHYHAWTYGLDGELRVGGRAEGGV